MGRTRYFNEQRIEWNKYAQFRQNDFFPLHADVLTEAYQQSKFLLKDCDILSNESDQTMKIDKKLFARNGLKAQMWLSLQLKSKQKNKSQIQESESTQIEFSEQQSNAQWQFRISPNFLRQHNEKLFWIFCPLLRLFATCTIAKFGDLRYIDAFLTAPFVMFDDNSLSRLELINCSQRTRQIISD